MYNVLQHMKTKIINFRATEELIKDLEQIVKEARHYRNRSDLINEILRGFIRSYRAQNLNSELDSKVKKR